MQDEKLGDQQVYDPMRATVQPSFRTVPREETAREESQGHGRLLFVSESNVCRSVLAEAFLQRMISTAGLAEKVSIESKVQFASQVNQQICLALGIPDEACKPAECSISHERRWLVAQSGLFVG